MANDNNNVGEIKKHLEEIDRHLMSMRQLLFASEKVVSREDLFTSPDGKVVEGIFDGEAMIDQDGKMYPVSPNYASKSKLVVGDKLKLTIAPDGRFLYKQIGPSDRIRLICPLEISGNLYWAKCKKKRYQILQASVTYYKANEGDELTVLVPKDGDADWATVENVINSNRSVDKESK